MAGINAYLAASHSTAAPWTRNDVYAVNALKGQFLGQGGGREAQNSEFLSGLQAQLGSGRGFGAFAVDPWHADGMLRFGRIEPWQLWLDSRVAAAAS